MSYYIFLFWISHHVFYYFLKYSSLFILVFTIIIIIIAGVSLLQHTSVAMLLFVYACFYSCYYYSIIIIIYYSFTLIIVVIISFTIIHIITLIINSFLTLPFMLMPAITTLTAAINLVILWFILVMFTCSIFQSSTGCYMTQALDVGSPRTGYKKIYKVQQPTRCVLWAILPLIISGIFH